VGIPAHALGQALQFMAVLAYQFIVHEEIVNPGATFSSGRASNRSVRNEESHDLNIEQVPARAWKTWADRTGGVIIDVREPWEWQSTGILPDSETISLANVHLVTQRFDQDTPLLLVCRSGNRSMTAAEYLAKAGYRNIANLIGGITALAA
jgi:rhodanese-related sulfurtransferase